MPTIADKLKALYNNMVVAINTTNEFTQALPDCYDAVEAKGGTIPAQETPANLPSAITSIPQTSPSEDEIIDNNDIFFIDHFGIQGAYKKEEVAQWANIQFVPKTYEYLTFHSFTHTLQEIKDGRIHCVGVLYEVNDCILNVTVKTGQSIVLTVGAKGNSSAPDFTWYPSLTMYWGDNAEVIPNAGSTSKSYSHTYSHGGTYSIHAVFNQTAWAVDYISASGDVYLQDNVNFAYIKNNKGASYEMATYAKAICLPYDFDTYGTNFCNAARYLEYLVMPPIATTIGYNFAINAVSLKIVVLSKATNAVSGNYLANVNTLKLIDTPDNLAVNLFKSQTRKIKLPNNATISTLALEGFFLKKLDIPTTLGVTTLSTRLFMENLNVPEGVTSYSQLWNYGAITNLTLPSTLTNINYTYAKYIHMKATTPPTMAASGRIGNVTTIYVPYSEDHSILEAYKTATNWTSLASKMVEETV